MPTDLPIHSLRPDIVRALHEGNRLVLTAPTGSGKSTQVPQFLVDDRLVAGTVLVLQPRRLAARLLAERVAAERGCPLGDEVGFQTRFESALSAATRIRFITEGILPRLLASDARLDGIGAVLLDEFHERSLTCDLSLGLLTRLQGTHRPDLKLAVMSATLEAGELLAYLGTASHVRGEGRSFPIDIRYLAGPPRRQPVWDLAADALAGLLREQATGDVLVFMPGNYEIRRTIDACRRLGTGERLLVLPLHGDLPPEQQHQAVRPAPGRKVIVATNIAETSLTIPGVRYVIDSGLARISRYDPARGFNALPVEPISRAAADQRAGRAGREGPGICLRLWSQLEHNHRNAKDTPEVRRVDLAEAVLQVRHLGFDDAQAFPWLEPPAPAAVSSAIALLCDLGAFGPGPRLPVTPVGEALAELPAHPRLGRILLAAHERHCLREATLAAAILTERPVLLGSANARHTGTRDALGGTLPEAVDSDDSDAGLPDPAQTAAGGRPPVSDLFRTMRGVATARQLAFDSESCARQGLNAGACRQILRTQASLAQACRKLHWPLNPRPGRADDLLKCLLLGYPDHLARRVDQGSLVCELRNGRRAELERRSAVRRARLLVAAEIREVVLQGNTPKTFLSLCSEVREEWLYELFPDAWATSDEAVWNGVAKAVERRRRVTCFGLCLEEKVTADPDPATAARLLADEILVGRLRLEGWTEDVEAWISRVRWVAELFPEHGLIRYDDTDRAVVVHELCADEVRYERVRRKPCLGVVKNLLSPADLGFIDRMAPTHLVLPCGRRMRLAYTPGQPARGSARIQDLYGLNEAPRVAGNRQRVLLEILAPNQRPVQITDDLAGFWQNHYPAVKRELCRKYPKHEWR